ncbi:MAG: FtsQ-type POTRA domain-containing protein [Desulfobulbaceae bacterium]|nr:FtsQ-type POTRA domain-containing protein [Desulfobulbaceae bacterium]
MKRQREKEPKGFGKGSFSGMGQRLLVLGAGFVVVLVLCFVIVSAGYRGLCRSDFFQISEIEIQGCRITTKRQILDLAGVNVHSNLLAMNIKAMKKQLEAQGWIERVEIKRDWPNRLVIAVSERKAVAIVNLKDGLYFLDRRGICFARTRSSEDLDFPVLSGKGFGVVNTDNGQIRLSSEYLGGILGFIRLAGNGNAALPRQNISEIHLDENDNAVLFLADHAFPIYFTGADMKLRYSRLARVLSWLYKKKKIADVLSVRVDYLENKTLVVMSDPR